MKYSINLIFTISLFSCLLFYSCEWDNNDENYIEREKPEDIVIGIDLAGVEEDKVIYIYNNSYLYYSLSTQGKTVLQTDYYLDGNSIGTDISQVFLSVDQIDDKEHNLKLVITLKSGSGSIADFANMEFYVGEYNFKIRFIEQASPENRLKVSNALDENNYFKLIWDKPALPVDRYEIYNVTWWGETDKFITTISPDQNWYVDKNYIYGFQQYKVVAYVSNSLDIQFEGFHTVKYNTFNEDNFEVKIIGLDKAKLTFTNPNPYPFCLVVKDRSGRIYKMRNENSVLLEKSLFPASGEVLDTYLLPADYEGEDYSNFANFHFYYSDDHLQERPNVITVDQVKKQLISSRFSNFYVYDKNLEVINSAYIPYDFSTESQINSLINGLVAIQDINHFIHIYSDNTINKELQIFPLNYTDKFATGKNMIAIADMENNILSIYDAATGTNLFVNAYEKEQNYSRAFVPYLSYDDKFIAILNYDFNNRLGWYKFYEISDNVLIEKKSETNASVTGFFFNYNKPDEVIIRYNTGFDIVDLATMQTKKSIVGNFRNIDVVTGNLLYKVNSTTEALTEQYVVLAPNYTDEVISFATSIYSNPSLFNNYFMSGDFYIHFDKIRNQ